ncbi:MAG: M20 family metallopeptidase [Chloroflexi bacterium]|nr:M20 family metallopeptidase [Chloroflexota bacterium]
MKRDVLQLTQEMVAIRSVSQWSNAEISDYIESWLKEAGFDEIERLEYTFKSDERKVNLVAKKGKGTGGLAFLSHSDTVPGMEASWDAFNPLVKNGRLYGRGSCDMKGPLAATMIAAASVDAAQLKKPLYIVVTADEEIGLYGAKHVVKHSKLLQESKPEYGVVAEPTRLIPVYGHKGFGLIKVTAHGKAAHSSTDEGLSAAFLIAPFLAEMAALKEQFQTDPSFMNDEFQPPTNGFNMIFDQDGKTNITAATASCTLTLRRMPNDRSQEMMDLIVESAEGYGFDVQARTSLPVYTATDSVLVQAACEATDNFEPETVPYGTDGFHFQKLMELVILGPGDIAVAHTVGESLAVAELETAVNIYKQMITTLC